MSERDGRSGHPPLPAILPIFPLAGVLLLPRGRLPLKIFEPRYLAMTRDALGGERLIGMIQPSDPDADGRNPQVYPIGCAGRITAFSETDDGLFLITLTGVARFRITEELPRLDGYRRVAPDWEPFAADREQAGEPIFDRERLIRGLQGYFARRQLAADWEAIKTASGERLVTSIAMLCPFDPSEKQALLEAADLADRAHQLIAIIEMAAAAGSAPEGSGVRH